MTRHEFLTALHRLLQPRTYLEIGVSDGRSLVLASVPSIGVDPAYRIRVRLHPDAHLVRATSDAFFARRDPLAPLRPGPRRRGLRRWLARLMVRLRRDPSPTLDIAFIDGMHWVEFAMRDFMNVERYVSPGAVIVVDDVLPRTVEEAARDRATQFWAGDVFKLVEILRTYRPDLVTRLVDTKPTGLLVVLNPDPSSTALADRYDEILAAAIVPDPQVVPAAILGRHDAVEPEALLASGVWETLLRVRTGTLSRAELAAELSRCLPSPAISSGDRAAAGEQKSVEDA